MKQKRTPGPRMVDVSHEVEHGMTTYPGLPTPVLSDFLSREESKEAYAQGTSFHIGRIEMVANTGTYVDSPFHRYGEGVDLAGLDLRSIANLEGVVVRVAERARRAIGVEAFESVPIAGRAVLVHTGWDEHWRTDPYFEGHPYLTEGAAEYLVKGEATLVGIDSLNIDSTDDGRRPVHSILLANEIPVVEHLCNLQELPREGFRFFAVPVKVVAFGSFPVRAFGLVGEAE